MKKIVPNVRKDELWKGIIEELFEEFLHFFFPEYVHEVDFSKPYEFLDKELQELFPASASKDRRADILVKLFLKSGKEKWLLIHVEVQGYFDTFFPKRMYIYNYRSQDRFDKEVVALAIMTDDNPNYRPNYYEKKTWNTKIRYDFDTYKLLDYEAADFENSDNPFAVVMQVARSFISNKSLKTDEDLLSLKLQLFRKLYAKGHDKNKIRKIANFIKLYVFFNNHDYFEKFENELDKITKYKPTMGLLELIKQRTLEEATRIGREEGQEKGIEKGITEIIKNMLAKNLDIEAIADLANVSISMVQKVKQEVYIRSLFKESLTIQNVVKQLKDSDENLLLNHEELSRLYQEMQVNKLLSDGLEVEEIMEKLDISKTFVMNIKKGITI